MSMSSSPHRRSIPATRPNTITATTTSSPLRPTSPLAQSQVVPSTPPGPPVPVPLNRSRTTSVTSLTPPNMHSSQSSPGPSRAPSTPPSSNPNKTRARDLLRKHYGLGVGTPSSKGGDERDPMNMDSPSFDAKAYYEQLITTANLSTLLRKENEIVQEILSLTTDRQNLVYNHHHELVAASSTIASMKARAESLDSSPDDGDGELGELDKLKAAFSEISRLSNELVLE